MKVRRNLAYFAVAFALAIAPAAKAADDIGEAVAVIDEASATGQVGQRTLTLGMKVYLGDLVKTDANGEAQLLFSDGTRMVVGPDSQLKLDKFVFRSGASDNKFAVRALSGAFRFITGVAEKRAYSITTPSGTIGLRGTTFDFVVTPDETSLLLMHGGASLCGNDGKCASTDVGE